MTQNTCRTPLTCLHPSRLLLQCPPTLTCTGNQAELQALATNPATRFSSLFDEAELTSEGKCPEGYLPANPPSEYYEKEANGKKLFVQCLKVKVSQKRRCTLLMLPDHATAVTKAPCLTATTDTARLAYYGTHVSKTLRYSCVQNSQVTGHLIIECVFCPRLNGHMPFAPAAWPGECCRLP